MVMGGDRNGGKEDSVPPTQIEKLSNKLRFNNSFQE